MIRLGPFGAGLLRGLSRLSAAVWLGLVVALGAVVAPALFAALERSQAGAIAGQLFRTEAHIGLVLGIWLLLGERVNASSSATSGGPPRFSLQMGLALGALFCTVLGYFALQPMMAAARAGEGILTFGQLHALSGVLFGLKGLCLIGLVWRLR